MATANELQPLVTSLTERLNATVKLLDELKAEYKQLQQAHYDHRLKSEKAHALLEREVEELKKNKDLWGNRAFALAMCLVSGIVGGLITYLVRKP